MRSRAVCATLLLALITASVDGQPAQFNPDDFSFLLVPIYMGVGTPGANGAIWKTRLLVRNVSASALTFFEGNDCRVVRFMPCFTPGPPAIPADFETEFSDNALLFSNPGVLFYVEKNRASELLLSLRVADAARRDTSVGTELPVVRESEFHAGTVNLLGIPSQSGWRGLLRVYSPDARAGDSVAVRLYGANGAVLLTTSLPLSRAEQQPFTFDIAYGQLSLDSLSGASSIRAEIDPPGPGARVWSFVSTTSNFSNEVVITTPSNQ